MKQLELLRQIDFGAQVAEDEIQELANYFVQTHQWDEIAKGKIDIVRGDKGAGKSAIYSLLISKRDEFFDNQVLFVPAETPRGATVFKDLIPDPPTSEQEFIWLWKVYLIAIVGQKLREYDIKGDQANKLYHALESAGLLPREYNLSGLLGAAHDLVRRLMKSEIQAGIEFDPDTGAMSGLVNKIVLKEPNATLPDGPNSVDTLFGFANSALEQHGYEVWILLDRLDVAFAESHKLEANALRALFRVYNDLKALDKISLKIFLREDIWKRIFAEGFREASHINDYVTLSWSSESLLNLIIRRILNNKIVIAEYDLDKNAILQSTEKQEELFYNLFPDQVEQGKRKTKTLAWILTRCADGADKTAPREIIHLLKLLKDKEILRLENGGIPALGNQLFDRAVFKDAIKPLSDTRLNQYLYAEYPDLRKYISALEHNKTEQTHESLSVIWSIDIKEAADMAEKLRDVGFFQRRGTRDAFTFWVPFIYRSGLSMIQGRAEEEGEE